MSLLVSNLGRNQRVDVDESEAFVGWSTGARLGSAQEQQVVHQQLKPLRFVAQLR